LAGLEDVYVYYVNMFMRKLGRVLYVEPYVGYGTTEKAHLFARVVYGSKRRIASKLRRGFRTFFTAQVPGAKVRIKIDGVDLKKWFIANRGGYIEEEVEIGLTPGWHDVEYCARGSSPSKSKIMVVENTEKVGIISDVDDTIMRSFIPQALKAIWTMMFRDPNLRKPVKGMPEFYRRLQSENPGSFVIYVSSAPWNVEPTIRNFIKMYDFPQGPLLARDWGPAENALFIWGTTYKYEAIKKVMGTYSNVKWILVGDDGQKDPLLYKKIVDEQPSKVEAVIIRQLSPSEQVFAHWLPFPYSSPSGIIVPVYYGPDGDNISEQLKRQKG
jgi:phosphatidate phosphatase APP1